MGQHSAVVSEETKDAVAKVGFMAFMAAAMGPVGIFVAALAVGVSDALDGDAGRVTSADLARDRVEAERQWLAEDRAWRAARREARERWLAAGSKPEDEPSRPSRSEANGRWWRRLWARMVVLTEDFKTGWRRGWDAAQKAREGGADWWETARTRPGDADTDDADDLDVDDLDGSVPDTVPAEWVDADPQVTPPAGDPQAEPPAEPDRPKVRLDKHNDHTPDTDDDDTEPSTEPSTGGEPDMTAPVAETNVDITVDELGKIRHDIEGVEASVDKLAAVVQAAMERMQTKGGTAATKAALDAAQAALGRLSEAVATADDEVAAAREGLRPAEQAQDALHSAGATGELVSAASE